MSGGRGRAMVFSYQSIPLGACTYGKRYVTNLNQEVLFDCPPYEWQSGTSDVLEICPRGNNKLVIIIFPWS